MAATSQVVIDEARWQIVLAREVYSNEKFVYAVRSTGIYCRPGCPSRRPRRGNVLFFPVPDAAENAGFRPCRRCRPEQARAASPQIALIGRACRSIEERDADGGAPFTLAALGDQLQSSPYHLERTFKRFLGITPRQYADALRLVWPAMTAQVYGKIKISFGAAIPGTVPLASYLHRARV